MKLTHFTGEQKTKTLWKAFISYLPHIFSHRPHSSISSFEPVFRDTPASPDCKNIQQKKVILGLNHIHKVSGIVTPHVKNLFKQKNHFWPNFMRWQPYEHLSSPDRFCQLGLLVYTVMSVLKKKYKKKDYFHVVGFALRNLKKSRWSFYYLKLSESVCYCTDINMKDTLLCPRGVKVAKESRESAASSHPTLCPDKGREAREGIIFSPSLSVSNRQKWNG